MESITIIKIGGNIIDDENAFVKFLNDFAKIATPKILIHGGGKLASKLSTQLNVIPEMIDGRRITDEKTIDIVTMVYAGLINKKIVAKLQANNCNAIGLSGADANLIKSHKRINSSIDYGFVGDVDEINTTFLIELLSKKYTPIIAPITHDKNGILLNTNADTIAAEIAITLAKQYKTALYYCFELTGLLKDINDQNSIIHKIKLADIQQLKEKQVISKGMLPKVDNIAHCIEQGVEKVILCNASDISFIENENAIFGTVFTKD